MLKKLLLPLLALSLLGCASKPQEAPKEEKKVITTLDFNGNTIETTYSEVPSKVLAVYQGSVETMLALGLSDKLVAAAGLDNAVPETVQADFDKVNYLSTFTPPKEDVLNLEPDLILSWGSYFSEKNLGDVQFWVNKGVNVYVNSNTVKNGKPRTLESEYNDIINIGKIFNVEDKAQSIVNHMKETIDEATKKVDTTKPVTTVILEPIKGQLTNYGKNSLAGDMVTSLKATLSLPDAPNVNKEALIEANPDVIFVVYMAYSGDNEEAVKKAQLETIISDPALASLDAIKNNRVHLIMLSEMYAAATRCQQGIETFAKGLYQ